MFYLMTLLQCYSYEIVLSVPTFVTLVNSVKSKKTVQFSAWPNINCTDSKYAYICGVTLS